MKKIAFLLMLLAIMSMVAVAQENETEDEVETEDELEQELEESGIMHDARGAEVRLLQLKKQVVKNSLWGEHILSVIDQKDYNVSTDVLADVVDQMDELGEDIDKAIASEESTVEAFVEMRQLASDLTRQFREYVTSALTVAQRKEIRDELELSDFQEVKEIQDQIRDQVHEFNKERILDILDRMGVEDQDIIDRIEAGDITVGELKQLAKEHFRKIEEKQREQFLKHAEQEREKMLEIRNRVIGRSMGLSAEERERISSLIQDDTLSYQEKKAKMAVFIQEHLDEKMDKM